ncbi:GspMb/PilO family protein [Methylorubrum salsuginis]|uniref:Type II secretion system (T2SS), protein M subtype b n=1 Tax=Methylorubrum salsuginis TaxID=414703 RepID=A0A1I4DUB5_9HYPH|nr:GspMb/PilO family protein [Methylorubrum salsuginis]SFK96529.1 Type II secretion system (T2SS), protein M subtype b [Methylorubrum salsuginis]
MKLPTLSSSGLLPNRPVLVALGGLGLLLALAIGPVSRAIDADTQIAAARDRLARAQAAAARPPQPAPLVAADADGLLAAFRARLQTLAGSRAVVIDTTNLEADPAQPTLPRLRAFLRGTAEGLHDLLQALETEAPLMAVEAAEFDIARAADEEGGRPLVMRASLTLRGVQLPPPPPETGGRAP